MNTPEIRFTCQPGCTRCCDQPGFVYLSEADILRAAKYLKLTPAAFEDRYIYRTAHQRRFRKPETKQCPFLESYGCSIHPAKPTQCKTFPFWPELVENRAYILQVAGSEEERFAGTLRQGMTLFEEAVAATPKAGSLGGDVVFKLHDTFGFPKELTRELVEDVGLTIDEEGFAERMAAQRERANARGIG